MGKNKGGKKGNPLFRVAGGKAAKAKAKLKAQPVSTNLKKLNTNTRSKIEELDSQLVEVRPNLTAAPKAKESVLNKDQQMTELPEPANIDQAVENIASLKSD